MPAPRPLLPLLTLAGLAAPTLAHAQTLTVSPGDTVTVSDTGTTGNQPGDPNSTSAYVGPAGTATTGAGRAASVDGGSLGITGGTFTGGAGFNGTGATVNTGGGRALSVQGGQVTISGGTFNSAAGPGHPGSDISIQNGAAIISGGAFSAPGYFNFLITGGTLTFTGTFVGGSQVITHGDGEGVGFFTGTFTNNSGPDQTYSYVFPNGVGGTIILASAPEPSQFAAFAIGLLGLGALALRARKRHVA